MYTLSISEAFLIWILVVACFPVQYFQSRFTMRPPGSFLLLATVALFVVIQAAPPSWTVAQKSVCQLTYPVLMAQVKEYSIFGERVKVGMIEIEFDQELYVLKPLRNSWSL